MNALSSCKKEPSSKAIIGWNGVLNVSFLRVNLLTDE